MKNPEFNLLDEPWIPVRLLDGTIADVGLLELLRRTTDIADLACELPTQSIAIQRLVLAVAYRVATPRDTRDWVRQWEDGAPTEQMIEYLERWTFPTANSFSPLDMVVPSHVFPRRKLPDGWFTRRHMIRRASAQEQSVILRSREGKAIPSAHRGVGTSDSCGLRVRIWTRRWS